MITKVTGRLRQRPAEPSCPINLEEPVLVLSALLGVFDLSDAMTLGGVGKDVPVFFLRMSREAAWSVRIGM
jgi:hypothetical protein